MTGTKGHRGWGWIRKRPSGRYQASYVGPDGKRHFGPTTFDTKMAAEKWLANEYHDVQNALASLKASKAGVGSEAILLDWISPSERKLAAKTLGSVTLQDYAQTFIADRNYKPKTRAENERMLARYIVPDLGGLAVVSLRPARIKAWYSKMLTDKPTQRARVYGLLHSICAEAVKDQLLQVNPCMITGAGNVRRARELVVPEITELDIIAAKIEPKFRALVLIGAWCAGMRFGELTELRRKDIGLVDDGTGTGTLEPGIIKVHRAVTHTTDPTKARARKCHIGTTKTDERRNVVVPSIIRADIQSHLDTYVGSDLEALLFAPARGGCHLTDRVARDAFNLACTHAGLSGVRLHDLRHFAGRQTARVANLPETMARLGHATASASLRYQGQVSGRDLEIAAALSALAQADRNKAHANVV